MSVTETTALPITVTAATLPGKLDPSAEAHFANFTRAEQYAKLLVESGDYLSVIVADATASYELVAQ